MNMNERIPLEEWKAKKQAEREALGQKQLAAMESFCGSGKTLSVYLYGRGRLGSRLSSGNAALVLQQIPLARAVNPMRIWNQNGRSVNKGAKGITVLSRKGNGKGYYLTPETVFDVSQTNGDTPCPQRTIQDDPKQQSIAVLSIVEMARVPVEIGEPATGVTEYLPDEKKIPMRQKRAFCLMRWHWRSAVALAFLRLLPAIRGWNSADTFSLKRMCGSILTTPAILPGRWATKSSGTCPSCNITHGIPATSLSADDAL